MIVFPDFFLPVIARIPDGLEPSLESIVSSRIFKGIIRSKLVRWRMTRVSSRTISYAAGFSALYLLLTYFSSLAFGPVLRGSDAHLLRALLMALLATRLRAPGGPTLMGVISGVLLLGIPAPAAFLYFPGSVAAGLVYDASLRLGPYSKRARARGPVISSSILSGLAESFVVTSSFFLIGFPFEEIVSRLAFGGLESGVLGIWFYSLGKNAVMSIVGAGIALALIPKLVRR